MRRSKSKDSNGSLDEAGCGWIENTLSSLPPLPGSEPWKRVDRSAHQMGGRFVPFLERRKVDPFSAARQIRLEWSGALSDPAHQAAERRKAERAAAEAEREKEATAKEQMLAKEAAEMAAIRAAEAAKEAEEDAEFVGVLPDAGEIVKNIRGGQDGPFSPADIERLRKIFGRLKEPGTSDIHKDDLPEAMGLMGFMFVDDVRKLAEHSTGYSTLDFEEFTGFAAKVKVNETAKFKMMFDSYDEDGGGELSTDELSKLMSSMGFTPLRSMITEALAAVDEDGSGSIGFEEFIHLLAVYRYSEGFTRKEVKEFYKCFLEFCEDGGSDDEKVVPVDMLDDLLLKYFGALSAKFCKKLGDEAVAGRPKKNEEEEDKGPPPPLNFSEVLLFGRRCRDMEIEAWRALFSENDSDGSGQLDYSEIQKVIKSIGYTLTQREIRDVCREVESAADEDGEEDGEMDFDEFVYLMGIFKVRDGFSAKEAGELQRTFNRFDTDGSGEVETVELGDMLRYLGESMPLEKVQRLLAQVDFNDSGSLDWREFLRFMRLHREEELVKWKDHFRSKIIGKGKAISMNAARDAVLTLGFAMPTERELETVLKQAEPDDDEDEEADEEGEGDASPKERKATKDKKAPMLTFDQFVLILNIGRLERARQLRKLAGFNSMEIEAFQEQFNSFDADRSGTIDAREVSAMLNALGFSMKTAKERDDVQREIDRAFGNARDAGVQDASLGGAVTFWVMVQLLRLMYNRRDQEAVDREKAVMEACSFSVPEVKDFREVFASCCKDERQFLEEAGVLHPDEKDPTVMSKDGLRRLLATLGVKKFKKQDLDDKVDMYDPELGAVDFCNFLRLMRWMLDTNFGNINGTDPK
eukprot:TRINITY_DN111419_c0_g1_i1.p1 TRINITY_DN111419_c0_g1~~TRINITY_DN111419_c0_g1_i1.p1  ORF type:complete len:863 (+),score=300.88 TRINITY_DN111419_c0_g1_i1:117-2705(+)